MHPDGWREFHFLFFELQRLPPARAISEIQAVPGERWNRWTCSGSYSLSRKSRDPNSNYVKMLEMLAFFQKYFYIQYIYIHYITYTCTALHTYGSNYTRIILNHEVVLFLFFESFWNNPNSLPCQCQVEFQESNLSNARSRNFKWMIACTQFDLDFFSKIPARQVTTWCWWKKSG